MKLKIDAILENQDSKTAFKNATGKDPKDNFELYLGYMNTQIQLEILDSINALTDQMKINQLNQGKQLPKLPRS